MIRLIEFRIASRERIAECGKSSFEILSTRVLSSFLLPIYFCNESGLQFWVNLLVMSPADPPLEPVKLHLAPQHARRTVFVQAPMVTKHGKEQRSLLGDPCPATRLQLRPRCHRVKVYAA